MVVIEPEFAPPREAVVGQKCLSMSTNYFPGTHPRIYRIDEIMGDI
jgi:hypothetical protein